MSDRFRKISKAKKQYKNVLLFYFYYTLWLVFNDFIFVETQFTDKEHLTPSFLPCAKNWRKTNGAYELITICFNVFTSIYLTIYTEAI